jgi:hypothetical protein
MRKKIEVREGDKYGWLTVIKEVEPRRYSREKSRVILCKCSCGNVKKVLLNSLRRKRTTSCGCFARMSAKMRATTHGGSTSPSYTSWRAMKERCLNKKNKSYKYYGGRGVKVCDRWMKFENFYKDMGDRPENKTLDRIDNNGDYCPENCEWSTRREQCNNRRCNHFIKFKGKRQTISQWSKELGFKRNLIGRRLAMGWSIKKTLTFKK